MHSCIYEGRVGHARYGAVEHRFRYSLFMMYLDLEELPRLLKRHWLLSESRLAPARFCRADHLGRSHVPLADAARDLVEAETGRRPAGPIRLLTQLRYWGYYFSPLNLLYCFDQDGGRIEAVVAEVSNTPWNERHCYVLWDGNRQEPDSLLFRHAKSFHVSPFMGMEAEYWWNLKEPGDQLSVAIESRRGEQTMFRAGMSLRRREITDRQLAATLLSYPLVTAKIIAAIYFEALRLWWNKCPYFPHPDHREDSAHGLKRSL